MQHFTLLEINQLVKETLDTQLEPSYWVIAEIGEMRLNQKGHCYLELIQKEDERIVAKSRATIWSYTYRNLSAWFENMTGERLREGITVLINVTIQYHEVFGLSFNIKDVDASFTLGERAKKRQIVINQLVDDGVFDMNKMLDLPLVPQHIAIISAPTAAGYGDFMHQLEQNDRGYNLHTELFNAIMQGEQAENSIIKALMKINDMSHRFDLVVLIRGGGASSDLDCFDSYELCSHIAQFPLPIVTGIGHERDETIADLVAHTRIKTPTAVSEFILQGIRAFEERLEATFQNLAWYADKHMEAERRALEQKAWMINKTVQKIVLKEWRKLDSRISSLTNTSKNVLAKREEQLNKYIERIQSVTKNELDNINRTIENYHHYLGSLDPKQVLKRGYSITTLNGKKVTSDTPLDAGMTIQTHLVDRTIESDITKIDNKN